SMAAEKVELHGVNLSAVLGKQLADAHIAAPTNVLTQELNSATGLTEHSKFTLARRTLTPAGVTRLHMNQVFKGIPIWGERVIISRDKNNNVTRIDGAVYRNIDLDIPSVAPRVSANDAFATAKKAVASSHSVPLSKLAIENEQTHLVI